MCGAAAGRFRVLLTVAAFAFAFTFALALAFTLGEALAFGTEPLAFACAGTGLRPGRLGLGL